MITNQKSKIKMNTEVLPIS